MRPVVGFHQVKIDANDEQTREHAAKFVEELITRFDVATAVGILLVGTEQILTVLLHETSPMPEANVASVAALLDALKENVLQHADCAMKINSTDKKDSTH